MDQKCRHIISKFFQLLKARVDLRNIRPLVEKRKIFTKAMLDDVYDTSNDADFFYDLLCTRGPYAFSKFINILSQTGHREETMLLQNEYSKNYTSVPYKLTSDPIGFCLIIINENFKTLKTLKGSQLDADALKSLFKTLGYVVAVVWDLKGEEMRNCLLEFSQNRNFSNVDSIVVFIQTHGDRLYNCDILLGTDENFVYITDIYAMFDNNNCSRLRGKPKMFFFQACRGNIKSIGKYEWKYTCNIQPHQDVADSDILTIVDHPSMSDMIVVHSTLPYHDSLRYADEGSVLCQNIVDVFSCDYLSHDLDTMLKSVCKRMEKNKSYKDTNQTLHVESFRVTGIVKFGHNA